jgi:hypothetical protein
VLGLIAVGVNIFALMAPNDVISKDGSDSNSESAGDQNVASLLLFTKRYLFFPTFLSFFSFNRFLILPNFLYFFGYLPTLFAS